MKKNAKKLVAKIPEESFPRGWRRLFAVAAIFEMVGQQVCNNDQNALSKYLDFLYSNVDKETKNTELPIVKKLFDYKKRFMALFRTMKNKMFTAI